MSLGGVDPAWRDSVSCRSWPETCGRFPCDVAHYIDHANGTHWRSPRFYFADRYHGPLSPQQWGQRGFVRSVPPSRVARVSRMPLGDVAARLGASPHKETL